MIADPDRVATLVPALAQVAVVCLLLAEARGTGDELAALHSTRLEMLLTKLIDTPVRAFVYETTDNESAPAKLVTEFCQRSRIPFALLGSSTADDPTSAADAIERLL